MQYSKIFQITLETSEFTKFGLTHCVKSAQVRSFSWSEYRKMRTKNNSVFGHFSRSNSIIKSLQGGSKNKEKKK